MSTDSQLVSHAAITPPTPEQLLRFVTWLFDTATGDGTSSIADHERLIATYLEEIA